MQGLELLPCPFCQRRLEVITKPGPGRPLGYAEHPGDECILGGLQVPLDSERVAAWNRRPSVEHQGLVEPEGGWDETSFSILERYRKVLADWAADESTPKFLREDLTRFLSWMPPIINSLRRAADALSTPPATSTGNAPVAPVVEPVAWRWRPAGVTFGDVWSVGSSPPREQSGWTVEPLYAHPLPPHLWGA